MTAKTAKVENYTAAQTEKMSADYLAAPVKATVDAIAAELGKTSRSVVAKLARLGIYQKAERTTKTGEAIVKKDETADAIGAVLSLTEAEVTSLTKANKTALKKIFAALANSKPLDGNE